MSFFAYAYVLDNVSLFPISNLLPPAARHPHRTAPVSSQRALCPQLRWRPLCLCAARGLDLLRTIRIHFFKRQKQPQKAPRLLPWVCDFHQLFPPRASQGPCIEPDGQQSTPCGSTTVQRPMLTGKRVVGARWWNIWLCRAPPCPTLSRQLRATQGRLKRCSNPPTWAALLQLPYGSARLYLHVLYREVCVNWTCQS